MPEALDPMSKASPESVSQHFQALTIKVLKSLEEDGTREILCKLDEIAKLIIRSTRAELEQVDAATNSIGAQLEEIAKTLPNNAEQAARLRTLATSLNAIGKSQGPPIPVS